MNRTLLIVILYVIGIILGALIFGLWSENTVLKSIIALVWTALFLITLVFADNKKN